MKQISFLINTSVNTLDHVKLLLRSLKENLAGKEHEILIFVDSDNEGTANYLREQKKYFYDLKVITHKVTPCVGYSRNINLMVELAKHKVVSYLQSDMVVSKDYDLHILNELEDNCILGTTRIEPPLHPESNEVITKNFGLDPNEFQMKDFLTFAESVRSDKTLNFFFVPFTFYKEIWLEIGGYDTLFRRSREDSDLPQRLIQKGIKIKQTFNANVYHFSCVSSRGKNWFDSNSQEAQDRVHLQNEADQIELRRFTRKWGRFTHGREKLVRLDMDMVWIGGILSDFFQVEYYFPRIWVPTQELKKQILEAYKVEHVAANKIMHFTDENWNKSKQFYNQIDYDTVFQVGEPQEYNIKVTVDMSRDEKGFPLKDQLFLLQNIQYLSDIFLQEETGMYDLGCAIVEIKNKVNLANSHIVVTNPPFDHSLLTIN
jgi:GT2 family glycosyltransferase